MVQELERARQRLDRARESAIEKLVCSNSFFD
jgi:hypothetical protein